MRTIIVISLISLLIFSSCDLKEEDVIDSSSSGGTAASITVKAPNGGESIMEGSSYNIQWTATGVTLISIQFSFDNGSSWYLIADSVENKGVYSWFPVPNLVSNQCKIRVSSNDGSGADESDQSFAIVKNSSQSLKMVAPAGGENWEAGSAKEIKWFSSGLDSVRIEYTTDNGNHWNFIAIDKRNTGIYYWDPLPNTPSTLTKIRIMDAQDGFPSTESPATFNIMPEPKLRVIKPNGGETLLSGGTRKIEWISENIENVKIAYSTDNGAKWNSIIESTPSIGFYNWTNIPDLVTQNCKIKIYDAKDGQPNDESDSVFTITNQITQIVEVESPNGSERWQAGTAQNIVWNSSGVAQVKIEFTTNNGIAWEPIIDQLSNTGAYEWNVPNSLSTQCLVRISDSQDGNPVDQSNSRFSIVPKPELKVLSPNGGESWAAGQIDTIKWYSVGIENVSIEYSTSNGDSWNEVVSSTESDGEYTTSFTIPANQYKIRIANVEFRTPLDESDGTFIVTDEPIITVITPNGEEEWFSGSHDNIRWTSTNIEDVKLEYTINNGASWNLINSSVPSIGVYSWDPIPNVSSALCRIKISDAKDGIPSDISDSNFTINNVQLIEVKSPNGEEEWESGSNQNITWDATGIKNVKIEFTTNNGQTWNTLVESTESSGFYNWKQLPNTASTNCKIRISDADDGAPSDESDQFFSIVPEIPLATIKVVTPNGGESYLSKSMQEIKWLSENIENVKIEYTTNGGAIWTTIVETTTSIGTYKWEDIPDINSSLCLVRISDASDGIPSDISDKNFQITNQVVKSLQVLSPNGGEDWEAGTKQNITWNSSNIENVKVELTTNQGSTWTVLVENYQGGAYEWNLAETLNSTQCQIRISDAQNNSISDISDGVFTISPRKYIFVTKPVGPVIYKDSDPIEIEWESTGIKNVGIKFTWTNGVAQLPDIPAYTVLVSKMANTGRFTTSFTIPADNQYHVIVYNADEGSDGTPSARNIGNFSIIKTEAPSITILTPNGGEQWLGNEPNVSVTNFQKYHPFEIRWNATNIKKVKIEWSTNGGGNWYVVPDADSTENDGIFVWAPGRLDSPARPDSSDNCKIKISSADKAVSFEDETDEFFSIHESKKIRVEYPNNGEDFYLPDDMSDPKASEKWPMAISWTSYAVHSVNIYYSLDNGVTWNTMATNYKSTGLYPWDFGFGTIYGFLGPIEHSWSSLGIIKIEDAALETPLLPPGQRIWDVNDVPFQLNVKKSTE